MPNRVVRYGVISTAKIVLNSHIPAARESANSEIVAISSRSASRARTVAEQYDIPNWHETYDELINSPDIDVVINALPNSMHCKWTIKAAEAGKHILCEKPLAVTIEEARRMVDSAKANNVVLAEAFTHRWNPHLRTARRLISQGEIGNPTSLQSVIAFSVIEPKGSIAFSSELGGGSLMDGGCYAVSACRFVLNEEPARAAAFTYDSGSYGVETTFNGLLEFPSGGVAHIRSSMEEPRCIKLIATGTKGQIEIPNMFDESGPVILKTSGKEWVEAVPAKNRFRVQLDEFSNCVLSGKSPEFPPEDGLANTAALVALLSAARTRTVVDVEKTEGLST
jgi:predicted dehydrogenase